MTRRSLVSLSLLGAALLSPCIGTETAFGQTLAIPIPDRSDPLIDGLAVTDDAANIGMWSPSQSWPLVSIHSALLPDGSVLTFGSPVGQGAQEGRTFVRWDPWTDMTTITPNSQSVNSFCSAAVLQPDTGGLLVSGGNEALQSTVFDYATGVPTTDPSQLSSDRWYATMTMLPDGRSLITGGSLPYAINVWQNPGSQQSLNDISMTPEIYTPGVGWSSLFGANSRDAFGPDHNRWWYPRQWVAPDGNVFGISSEKWWRLDPNGSGSIIALGDFKTGQNDSTRPNIGPTSTAVMFDVGRVLQVGGNGYSNEHNTVSSERATVFDINGGNPVITDVPSMQFRRQWPNSIVLPTGDVVITGGTQFGDSGNPNAVYQAELWDPDTEVFSALASANIIRNYHSTTILLEDGAIFSSGGGVPGPVTNFNYEIFYPPYLFDAAAGPDTLADRPRFVSIDDTRFGYGSSFQVELDDTRSIASVALIGLSTTTHSFNMGQRYYPAGFSQAGNLLTVDAPPTASVAPPGFYLLHAVDDTGVPSRGFIISLGEPACDTDPDCDDGNACTLDECNGGFCSHANSCTDPLAIYPFETGAIDSTGNGNDGSLVNGASIVAGLAGNAVDLDAGTEHVDLPDGLVQACDDFTFAAWVQLDSNANWNRIFDFGNDTETNMFLTPKIDGSNTVRFALKVPTINGGAEEQLSFPFAFPIGTWTHVAVVIEGSTGRLYIDGSEVATATITGNPSDMGATLNNWLGQSQWPDPNMDGRLDEVELSCRAYSAAEIANLADPSECTSGAQCDDGDTCTADICTGGVCSNPQNGTCSPDDPLAYYAMDDGGGTVAADLSGSGNDASLLNGASFTTAGQFDGAVDINGGSQHVELPDGLVSVCNDFTFATWVWLDANPDWNRIFDFGTDTGTNMFLTPKVGGANAVRFGLKVPGINGGATEEVSFPFTFPIATWTHVAVVLEDDTGTLFIDGSAVASAPVTGNPADMGSTLNNWLGQSQWPDPNLDGRLDEVWISCLAYTESEIAALIAGESCNDGIQNQDETDVDCGGVCPACPFCGDAVCNGGEDCSSCESDCGACPTCDDGIQNQDEAGVDCGGVCPDPCPSCNDGVQNQDETGVDCGGVCPACPTCNDGVQNQDETGVDCGGSTCPACPFCGDDSCNGGEDCGSCETDCGICIGPLIDATFDTDAEGFSYADDTFRGTNQPGYADGSLVSGALEVELGGLDGADIPNMSGGWGRVFGLSEPRAVELSIGYTLTADAAYEPGECSELLVSVDGVLYGAGANDYAVQICDGGGQSGVFSTTTQGLAVGSHTIVVGTFNNLKTEALEVTTLQIGSVQVDTVEPECFVDGDCDDADVCTDDMCSAGVCTNAPNGGCAPPGAIAFYPMDDASGTTATDASANGNDAALTGGASFTGAGESGGAVDIDGGGEYVDLPDGLVSSCSDFTFAAWVWLDSNPDWNRIFDFGSDSATNMFLTPKVGGSNTLRFALKVPTINGGAEEQLSFPFTFPLGAWTHVAVVLGGDTGTLFVNGSAVASATVTGDPADMGNTPNNWLGQSQYPDPNLDGRLDEVLVSCTAYTEAEITALVVGESCNDGIQNQDETGVDCGGVCPACPFCGDAICNGGEDCASCETDCGACPTCDDGIQNQDEAGVDCGGVCPDPCPTCNDGVQNQDETGVDCGGVCPACPFCGDAVCNGSEDCGSCEADCGACPTCDDGIQNQDEAGVDCGGVCPDPCPTCNDGVQNQDETGVDCGGSSCPACPSCNDGVQNQDETGVDCGGSSCPACPFCGDGTCNGGEDCSSCETDCGICTGPLIDADFASGAEGFSYADDSFRGTSEPSYASGTASGGALTVQLGGLDDDDITGMSGGWSHDFDLLQAGPIDIVIGYSLSSATQYEAAECSQVLVSVDGVLQGSGGNDYVVQICSGGSQSGVFSTTVLGLDAGSHTLTVGGFNNAKTEFAESTTIQVDDVFVEALEPECVVDSDCSDLNACTDDVCTAGVCSNPNNASCIPSGTIAAYLMDDGSGTLVSDSSGNGNDGTLVNGAGFTAAGQSDGAADIDGATEYVDLPDGLLSACTNFSFAAWVWLDSNPDWNRIFDFGTDTATNMFLTPKVGGSNTVRFALKVPGINGGAEEQISFPFTFPLSTWTHVALVLDGDTGTLFIDGAPVASNTIIGDPADMGNTPNNWLGQSQWPDPNLNGRLDEVWISCSAFSEQEINDLMNGTLHAFNRRSLFETTQAAVAQFDLEETLDALGANAGLSENGALLYRQMIDSHATAPGSVASAVHCGDENPGGPPTLNGYPIECDRLETQQLDNVGSWFATAVVNRLDLAPADGAHCGNQRLIFANDEPIGNGRMLMIIEAQVPNPTPAAGQAGCLPIAEFWDSLEAEDDPATRGALLRDAFLLGGGAGFGPFMSADHLVEGSGQIRTNAFNDDTWTMREFKLVIEGGDARLIPFPVAGAPHGALWNDSAALPAGDACRMNFLEAIDGLITTDDPAAMEFNVDEACRDAESLNDFTAQNYPSHLLAGDPDGFQADLATLLDGTGLSPVDVAARARFAGSCIGCHQESKGSTLGNGVQAPSSLGFVHVEERFLEACDDGPCFPISQALQEVFLPHRAEVLDQLLGN